MALISNVSIQFPHELLRVTRSTETIVSRDVKGPNVTCQSVWGAANEVFNVLPPPPRSHFFS
jgi:hypothetical protein